MAKIDAFNFGFIVVDGKQYVSDVLILSDGSVTDRDASRGRTGSHFVSKNEIERLLRMQPDALIIGCGTNWMVKLSEDATIFLEQSNYIPILLSSPLAVEKYNKLVAEQKRVAAIIHVTC